LRSSTDARLPFFITCVLESTFSDLSLPDSVRVLLERSKLCTRPVSALKWPLVWSPEVEALALEPDDVSLLDAVELP
jgi:hypothetical protein